MTTLTAITTALPTSLARVHTDYQSIAQQAANHVAAGEPGATLQVDGVRMTAEEVTLQVTLDGYIDTTK